MTTKTKEFNLDGNKLLCNGKPINPKYLIKESSLGWLYVVPFTSRKAFLVSKVKDDFSVETYTKGTSKSSKLMRRKAELIKLLNECVDVDVELVYDADLGG